MKPKHVVLHGAATVIVDMGWERVTALVAWSRTISVPAAMSKNTPLFTRCSGAANVVKAWKIVAGLVRATVRTLALPSCVTVNR